MWLAIFLKLFCLYQILGVCGSIMIIIFNLIFMNEMTMYLGQLLAPVYLVVALGFLFHGDYYKKVYASIKDDMFMLVMGLMSLVLGIVLVKAHNLWTTAPEVIVSLVAWGALLKGLWIVLFPKSVVKVSKWMSKSGMFNVAWVIALVLGLYLGWAVYLA